MKSKSWGRALASAIVLLAADARSAEPSNAPTAVDVATAPFRKARWQELVPADWDPMKAYRAPLIGSLRDNDPRAVSMLHDMQQAWKDAPTNPQLEGAPLQLSGYVVPLDEVNGQMTEFLLVPYFGACIHVPPPASNQIVHVVLFKKTQGIHSMDAVRVSGKLRISRLDTDLGASGYEMRGALVDRY